MNIPALWWNRHENNNKIRCELCYHSCIIEPKSYGYCKVRYNDNGTLTSPFLGKFTAIAIDPIEKKPLYNWKSKSNIFSLGSLGCTMNCTFCQNSLIAQQVKDFPKNKLISIPSNNLANEVKKHSLTSIAFTYNEPSLQAEYILQAAAALKDLKIDIALITNGMMQPKVMSDLIAVVDAFNIDLKTFIGEEYKKLGGSLDLVCKNISLAVASGKHVELTMLIVPGISDDLTYAELAFEWISKLSRRIPVHLSRYFPANNYTKPPTSIDLLLKLKDVANNYLDYVYIGNV